MGTAVNGKLYVLGGFISGSLATTQETEIYDFKSNSWTRGPDLPGSATHSGVAAVGSLIYLVGGFLQSTNDATSDVWIFDTDAGTYSMGPPLPDARAAMALVLDGTVLHAIAGLAADGETDSPEHTTLDLAGDAGWVSAPDLPNPRNHLGGAMAGPWVMAVGGRHGWDEQTGNQAEVDAFDPTQDAWTQMASLPIARSEIAGATFAVDGGLIVVGGGMDPAMPTANVYLYDQPSNTWSDLPDLPGPRKGAVANRIGKSIVVTTGSPTGTDPAAQTWIGCCLEGR